MIKIEILTNKIILIYNSSILIGLVELIHIIKLLYM